jgi:hypothetical protein
MMPRISPIRIKHVPNINTSLANCQCIILNNVPVMAKVRPHKNTIRGNKNTLKLI